MSVLLDPGHVKCVCSPRHGDVSVLLNPGYGKCVCSPGHGDVSVLLDVRYIFVLLDIGDVCFFVIVALI